MNPTGSGLDLNGRTAIVSGAGSPEGIGFATARALGLLGAGVRVASTTDRIGERVAELESEGITARGFVGDLTDPSRADALVAETVDGFGRLDVLVNNAGMTSLSDPEDPSGIEGMSDANWQKTIDRNLTTAFNLTRAAVKPMLAAGFGRIVNVTSASGPVTAYPGDVGYHAAKAGMVGLTRAVAIETAARGVTVNAVAPGWIATSSSTTREVDVGAATPVGRSGTSAEVAAAVVALALPAAAYTTGQVLVVDGANSIMEEKAG
ncbi:MAG: SDR family oxidoreductase [Solirubrobacterales bacterium]|nr:SDR family oxidoreductase [Solirubrobacterales bacterium]